MQNEKLKAMLIVGLLIIAIGVPAIYFATTIQGERDMKPVAVITAPDVGHISVPVGFSAQRSYDPDGRITLYVWNFGDGTTSAGEFVNHTYRKVGNYTVKLTVYDNAGSTTTTEKKITIKYYEERARKVSVNELLRSTDEYMGTEVIVKGVFAEGRNYSFFMVNVSGSRGIRVYVEPGAPRPESVNYGDLMEVRALFTVYQNSLELKVENNSKDYVRVVGHNAPVAYVSIAPDDWEQYNNSLVSLNSRVTDVYASYRYKMDNITVYVQRGASHTGTPAIGDYFNVRGFLTFYKPRNYSGYMELIVRNNTADFSKYVNSSYTPTSINCILNTPEKLYQYAVNTTAVVVNEYASWRFWVGGQESNRSVQVYVEKGAVVDGYIFTGAQVQIKGMLTEYNHTWELKIRNGTDDKVVVLNTPTYIDASVPELLSNASLLNKSVHSWGVVSWTYHNATSGLTLFGLYYGGKEITVVGFKGSNISDMVSGYHADVYGLFTEYKGEYEIKINPDSYDHVVCTPQNYTEVNITAILKNPLYYNNTLVHIPYAKVVGVYQSWKFWVSNNTTNSDDITVYVEKGGVVNGTPVAGATAEIWAMVTEYNGTWELKIRNGTADRVDIVSNVSYTEVSIDTLLNNATPYNNTLVYVPEAVVKSIYNATWLFWVSNSTNNTEDISVYIEKGANNSASVYVGAKVAIWGQVTQYNGKWELKIRNGTPDKVVNVNVVNYTNVSLTAILNNVSAYNNTNVHIPNATVVGVSSSHLFWVSNNTTNSEDITVYVDFGVSVPVVGVGDILEIYGRVEEYNGSYEIHVRSGTPDRIEVLYSQAKYVNFSYIHEVNSTGALVHLGEQVIVNGTVIAEPDVFSFTTSTGTKILKFYIENTTQSPAGGVVVFGYGLNYTALSLTLGDRVEVRGTVAQYNGEAELKITSLQYIKLLGTATAPAPLNLSTGYFGNWSSAEKVEGMLVHVSGTVTEVNTTYHYIYVDDGSGAIEIYFRSSLVSMPNVSVGDNISVTGIVSQYDKSSPYTGGYEILPRYAGDVNITTKSISAHKVVNEKNKMPFEVIVWKRRFALIAEDMLVH
ncbi:MAG: PKD domain-containing protein [Euryarchaeota archaeon]|nr:PKD domain-containing protein [Euryarchaeota archaeon]